MKKILYSLNFALLACLASCTLPDDGPSYDATIVNIDNLITVDEVDSFTVGDVLWIDIQHPIVFQNEDGEKIDLEALQSPNFESVSYAYFALFKKSGFENPQIISLSPEELRAEIGEVEPNGTQILAYVRPDYEVGKYQARVGIVLKEAGDFFINGLTTNNKVQLYVDGLEGQNVIFITTINGADENQNYNFTVSE